MKKTTATRRYWAFIHKGCRSVDLNIATRKKDIQSWFRSQANMMGRMPGKIVRISVKVLS